MKYLISFLLFICVIDESKAQNKYIPAYVNDIPFSVYLETQYIKPPPVDSIGRGIKGLTWVKFKISKEGYPESLTFSPQTDRYFEKEIRRLFDSANTKWPTTNAESTEKIDLWIVLPIQYLYETSKGVRNIIIDPIEMNKFFTWSDEWKEQRYVFIQTSIIDMTPRPHPWRKFKESQEQKKKATTKVH